MERIHLFHLAVAVLLSTTGNSLLATVPCVLFDVVPSAAAVDVTPPEFFAANPTEKLIVIQFPISSLVRLESENGLIQYLYVISGTNALFQIVDYAPKTQLDSDVKGKVSVEKHRGESTTLGLKVYTPHDLFLDGDATAHHGANDSDSTRFEQLPPLRLIAASGTMHRGLSAYFKLKPSTRTTLEGDKTFAITAHVPASWRAGLIHVNCQAFGQSRRAKPYRDQDDLVCGFVVGVYMQGDAVPRKACDTSPNHNNT